MADNTAIIQVGPLLLSTSSLFDKIGVEDHNQIKILLKCGICIDQGLYCIKFIGYDAIHKMADLGTFVDIFVSLAAPSNPLKSHAAFCGELDIFQSSNGASLQYMLSY
jgi:hypothetical protein